jgi:hypothetical protein
VPVGVVRAASQTRIRWADGDPQVLESAKRALSRLTAIMTRWTSDGTALSAMRIDSVVVDACGVLPFEADRTVRCRGLVGSRGQRGELNGFACNRLVQ